jgi:hypothetical protein
MLNLPWASADSPLPTVSGFSDARTGEGTTIFLHIPKTGGTSFRDVVEKVYTDGRCVSLYSIDPESLADARYRVGEADAVYGHLYYGVHEALGIAPRYVTIVRDPVARVVSFFRHQARDECSEYFERIRDGLTLLGLLESGECHQVNNHMVRIITGYERSDPVHDPGVLQQALENLRAFEFVGVAERMDESAAMIASRLGWDRIPPVPRLNTSPNGQPYPTDDGTRAAILERNALDVQLHAHVVAEFDRHVKSVRGRQRRLWLRPGSNRVGTIQGPRS